ncbi:PAS domain S-box protein [Geobacter sp. FeAm09]|uniref:PAS domain-containing sensor histidine kinase n=1 Tax=Geobacter sp. FeAm09 TaxID=2597769 RepID=UPI0011EEA975|nr:PAS domain S-box protein [Geobacter sp. FeAm09]QEM68308.1 PAS domain S-box protein [Geobacter sp. FeAm09]
MKRVLEKADRRDLLKIIAIYGIFSCLWIYFSDTALSLVITDPGTWVHLSVFKGFFFVVITGALLYQLISRYLLESRRLKETIKNRDMLFSLLYEGMMDAFASVDMDGGILQYNEVFRAMLGYGAEELRTRTYEDLTPEKWHAMERRIVVEQVIPRGYSDVYEKEYRRKDGSVFPVELRTQLIRDDRGNPFAMWAIVHDITERKRAQDTLSQKSLQLEELNQSLEKRVAETVVELRQRDQMLFQQSRLAAMGEMVNNIAHQWRQPLNNVGLIVQNLHIAHQSGELTGEEFDREVAGAMQIIHHMSATIDDFRNFFRQDKDKRLFSVAKAVHLAVGLISAALKHGGITVELHLEEDVTAFGYKNEYAQVLLNIVSNAKDVLQERRVEDPRIVIRAFRDNDRSVVTVHDNGGGIGEDIRSRIFDPYFTTKSPDQGTGIGLFMSKMIIEKNMAGRLTAANAQGGAEFRIELPVGPSCVEKTAT